MTAKRIFRLARTQYVCCWNSCCGCRGKAPGQSLIQTIDPILSQLCDTTSIESSRSSTKFSAGIFAKISQGDLRDIYLCEAHWTPRYYRLRFFVDVINKNTHPLLARAMRVNGASDLTGSFDLNAFHTRLNAIIWVNSLDQEVGMSIEVPVLNKCARMLRQAC